MKTKFRCIVAVTADSRPQNTKEAARRSVPWIEYESVSVRSVVPN
jgi:hypothetical protein